MAKIVAAHDLSGVGRCSLTTALAVLPVMGHTCYPLPTAVLSQQTAFSGYSFLDFTPHLPGYLKSWQNLALAPDLIYTGFLGSGEQAALIRDFIGRHPRALAVVDPVMGDGGALYGCFERDFVKSMKELVAAANIITPNITEFLLLAEAKADEALPEREDEILKLAKTIPAPKLQAIVITNARKNEKSCNLVADLNAQTVTPVFCEHTGIAYSGTGDLFTSVICGSLANGEELLAATKKASAFVAKAAAATPRESDPRYGLDYEPLLGELLISRTV